MTSGPSGTGEFTGPLPPTTQDGGQPDGGSRGKRIAIIASITAGAVALGTLGYALMGREGAGANDDGSDSSNSAEGYGRSLVGAVAEGATVDCVAITEGVYGPSAITVLEGGTKTVAFVDPSNGVNAPTPPKASSLVVNVPPVVPDGASLKQTLFANICAQPSLAAAMLNAEGSMQFGESTFAELAAEGGWDMPAQGDGKAIAAYANDCYPENRDSATADEVANHLACETNAERAIAVLTQGKDLGVVVSDTELTYRLATVTSDPAKYDIPSFAVLTDAEDQEYNGSFQAYEFGDSKTIGCIARVGINVGTEADGASGADQRAALLPCEETPETTPSQPTSTGTPAPRPSSTPTSRPSSTPTPTPSGKFYTDAPAPDRPIVPAPTEGYVDRNGQSHEEPYTPPASAIPPEEQGSQDSGDGAVNTVESPATSAPAAEAPVTNAPAEVPVMP